MKRTIFLVAIVIGLSGCQRTLNKIIDRGADELPKSTTKPPVVVQVVECCDNPNLQTVVMCNSLMNDGGSQTKNGITYKAACNGTLY